MVTAPRAAHRYQAANTLPLEALDGGLRPEDAPVASAKLAGPRAHAPHWERANNDAHDLCGGCGRPGGRLLRRDVARLRAELAVRATPLLRAVGSWDMTDRLRIGVTLWGFDVGVRAAVDLAVQAEQRGF